MMKRTLEHYSNPERSGATEKDDFFTFQKLSACLSTNCSERLDVSDPEVMKRAYAETDAETEDYSTDESENFSEACFSSQHTIKKQRHDNPGDVSKKLLNDSGLHNTSLTFSEMDSDIYQRLVLFSQNDLSDIITTMLQPGFDLNSVLDEVKQNTSCLMIFMKIMAVVCKSNSALKLEILLNVSKGSLLDSIRCFLQKIIDDPNPIRLNSSILAFFDQTIEYFSSVFVLLPEMTIDLNLKEIIDTTLNACERFENCDPQTFLLRFKLNDLLVKVESFPTKHPQIVKADVDFRSYSLYPTREDLQFPPAFDVEPNLTKGMYVDLEHYVNVHFRLLRECFFRPVVLAVQKNAHAAAGGGGACDATFWTNITFRQVTFCRKSMCFEITFSASLKSPPFLAHGSLVTFSNDNFQNVFFGVVEEWNASAESAIVMLLDEADAYLHEVFGSVFVMLDTTICLPRFNYPVLMRALLNKSTCDFPSIRYLVNAEIGAQSVQPLERRYRQNLVLSLDSEDKLMKFVDVTLDVDQFTALKSALTDPITLIAGCRGAGKTLLAGKILQVLLHDKGMRNTVKRFPILMICRSNEALDEFLYAARNSTRKMVRIGGTTSNNHLKPYNLRALRRGSVNAVVQKVALLNLQRQIRSIADDINRLSKFSGVLSFDLLKNVMVERHWYNLDEKRLLALLLDDNGFTFDYAQSAGRMEERVQASIAAELDYSKAYGTCTREVETKPLNSSSSRAVSAEEFFVDQVEDSNGTSEAEDRPANRIVYALTLQKCAETYHLKMRELESRLHNSKNPSEVGGEMYYVVEHVQMLRRRLHILKTELESLSTSSKRMDQETYIALQQKDFQLLSHNERWIMYKFWVCQLRNHYVKQLRDLVEKYRKESRSFDQILDLELLSRAELVGITTACITKFLSYLEILQPSIVIVEEATEIIEAEIVAPLSKACDQLIMLGDLRSMKPLTPNAKFSRKFSMDTSLFERLMNNGLHCHQLKVQRKTPPEINSVLRSTFVTDLYSDVAPNRVGLLKVKGFEKSVFFLNTNTAQNNGDVSTVNFILRMCWYLMKHSVPPNEISVLSVSAEQAYVLKESFVQTSDLPLKQIHVSTVENFRSKTNKIILLSFVNCGAKSTDMDDKNRVLYTALTRATRALYMVGDAAYVSLHFPLWPAIIENLQKWASTGDKMVLSCEKHRKFRTVSAADDFWNGCGEICGEILPCRHTCPFPCHLDDVEHTKKYTCHAKLSIQCVSGHTYQRKCGTSYQACPVEVTIPSRYCGHSVTKKCGECLYSMNCSQICNEELPCGHRCPELCHRLTDPLHKRVRCTAQCGKIHADCTRGHVCTKLCSQRCGICLEMDWCMLECGHKTRIMCSFDISRVKCYEKCAKICAVCGERCQKYCYEDCQPCTSKVLKIIEGCGHEKLIACGIYPESKLCEEWVTISSLTTPCGHNELYIPCNLRNEDSAVLSSYCRHPCETTLMCGHLCTGTCGSCFQERIHAGCGGRCDRVFVCGHRCESPCEGIHEPCKQICSYFCRHQKCNIECGLPCVPCKATCDWKCKHSACTRTCSELCDRTACYEPCDQNLNCGHPCIGFCGEPCPPLCRYCDQKFFAINHPIAIDDPKSRFVLLADCQHVVESRSLEEYLYKNCLVSLKKCPYSFCQKPIFSTLRYRQLVKHYFQHVKNIKKLYLENDDTAHELTRTLDKKMYDVWILFYLTDMNLAVNDVERAFFYHIRGIENRRAEVPLLLSLNYYADLMLDVGSRYADFRKAKFSRSFSELLGIAEEVRQCVYNILLSLKLQVSKISIELVDDLYCEVNRFHKMIDFCVINKFGVLADASQMFSAFRNIFCAAGKFTDERNNRVNNLLREMQKILQCSIPLVSLTPRNVQLTATIKSKLLEEKLGRWYVCKTGHYYRSTEHHDWSTPDACPRCNPIESQDADQRDSSQSFIAVLNAV